MAARSDERVPVSNPVTGVSLSEVPGDESAAEIRLEPGAQGPAEHVHRTTEERFEVREGRVTFRIDGRERRIDPGTEIRVSPGTPHTFRNEGSEAAAMFVRTVPPNTLLGEVVVTLFGLAHDGKVDERGRPGFLRAMAMAEAAVDETYFTGAPYALQRALGETLGPLARTLGYRATEERYLDDGFWRARAGGADGSTDSTNSTDSMGSTDPTDSTDSTDSTRGTEIPVVDDREVDGSNGSE